MTRASSYDGEALANYGSIEAGDGPSSELPAAGQNLLTQSSSGRKLSLLCFLTICSAGVAFYTHSSRVQILQNDLDLMARGGCKGALLEGFADDAEGVNRALECVGHGLPQCYTGLVTSDGWPGSDWAAQAHMCTVDMGGKIQTQTQTQLDLFRDSRSTLGCLKNKCLDSVWDLLKSLGGKQRRELWQCLVSLDSTALQPLKECFAGFGGETAVMARKVQQCSVCEGCVKGECTDDSSTGEAAPGAANGDVDGKETPMVGAALDQKAAVGEEEVELDEQGEEQEQDDGSAALESQDDDAWHWPSGQDGGSNGWQGGIEHYAPGRNSWQANLAQLMNQPLQQLEEESELPEAEYAYSNGGERPSAKAWDYAAHDRLPTLSDLASSSSSGDMMLEVPRTGAVDAFQCQCASCGSYVAGLTIDDHASAAALFQCLSDSPPGAEAAGACMHVEIKSPQLEGFKQCGVGKGCLPHLSAASAAQKHPDAASP
ncbi:unnamed protein product [Chrysoparadoxa australica]